MIIAHRRSSSNTEDSEGHCLRLGKVGRVNQRPEKYSFEQRTDINIVNDVPGLDDDHERVQVSER